MSAGVGPGPGLGPAGAETVGVLAAGCVCLRSGSLLLVLRIEEVDGIELQAVLVGVLGGARARHARAPAGPVGRGVGPLGALLLVQQKHVAVQAGLRRRPGTHVGNKGVALQVHGGQLVAKAVDVVLAVGGGGSRGGVGKGEVVELDVAHHVVAELGPLVVALGGGIRVCENQGEAVVGADLGGGGGRGGGRGVGGGAAAAAGALDGALLVVVREVEGEVDHRLLLGVGHLERVAHGDLLVAVLVLDHQEALRGEVVVVDDGGDHLALVQRVLDGVGDRHEAHHAGESEAVGGGAVEAVRKGAAGAGCESGESKVNATAKGPLVYSCVAEQSRSKWLCKQRVQGHRPEGGWEECWSDKLKRRSREGLCGRGGQTESGKEIGCLCCCFCCCCCCCCVSADSPPGGFLPSCRCSVPSAPCRPRSPSLPLPRPPWRWSWRLRSTPPSPNPPDRAVARRQRQRPLPSSRRGGETRPGPAASPSHLTWTRRRVAAPWAHTEDTRSRGSFAIDAS